MGDHQPGPRSSSDAHSCPIAAVTMIAVLTYGLVTLPAVTTLPTSRIEHGLVVERAIAQVILVATGLGCVRPAL